MTARPKVFLSSTSKGLAKAREAACRGIIGDAECEPVNMEEWGASADSADVECQQRIQSSDVYLLLTGKRYGSVPKGSEQSYTEREYRYARIRGLPRLWFQLEGDLLREEEKEERHRLPDEVAEAKQSQERFLKFVGRDCGLRKKVCTGADLERWVASSLREHLDQQPWGVSLFGRQEDLTELARQLVHETDPRALLLLGHSGVGKTTVTREFTRWLERVRDWSPESRLGRVAMLAWALPDAERKRGRGATGLDPSDLVPFSRSMAEFPQSWRSRKPAMRDLGDAILAHIGRRERAIVVFDNVWPSHTWPLLDLCDDLGRSNQISFLFTSRFPRIVEKFQSDGRLDVNEINLEPLPIPPFVEGQLEERQAAALDLLVWGVAKGITRADAAVRPELHRLEEVLRPLARASSGYPKMIELMAGLVRKSTGSIEELRDRVGSLEIELAVRPGETSFSDTKRARLVDRRCNLLLQQWLRHDEGGLPSPQREVMAVCSILPPAPAVVARRTG